MSSTTIRMSDSAQADGALTAAGPARAPAAFAPAALAPCAVLAGDTADCLPPGTRLRDFVIDRVLGEGGFGVVYSAYDLALGRRVAIKEYMPAALARRRSDYGVQVRSSAQQQLAFAVGLKSFVKEARLLARFDHPALIKVHQFWEENGTAYFVMPYYTAPTLKSWLANLAAHGTAPDDAWIRAFFRQALDALSFLHRNECLHRDVSPENILVLNDRTPLLLDFGAARRVVGDFTQALTVILKPGYAPLEQYTGSTTSASVRQGPWTDLYALCAVMYFVISGRPPFAAVDRVVSDRLLPAADVARGRYSESLLAAIDAGLQLHPGRRPQSAEALAEMLGAAPGVAKPVAVASTPAADPDRTLLTVDAPASNAPLTAVARSLDFGTARTTRTAADAEATVPDWHTSSMLAERAADWRDDHADESAPAGLAQRIADAVARHLAADGARVRLAAIGGVTLAVAAAIAGLAAYVSGDDASTATVFLRAPVATSASLPGDIVAAPLPITVAPTTERVVPAAPAIVASPPAVAASVPATAPAVKTVAPVPSSALPSRAAPPAPSAAGAARRPASAARAEATTHGAGSAAPSRPAWTTTAVPAQPSAPANFPAIAAAPTNTSATRGLPIVPLAAAVAPGQAVAEVAVAGALAAPSDTAAIADSQAAANGGDRATAAAVTLRAISKPQPQFPAEALRDGIQHGRVTVAYTVETDGSIAQVRIVSAEPQSVFNRAARNAVARWRFEPVAQATQGAVEFVFDATK